MVLGQTICMCVGCALDQPELLPTAPNSLTTVYTAPIAAHLGAIFGSSGSIFSAVDTRVYTYLPTALRCRPEKIPNRVES
jgi:hypothetical protein